MTTPTTTAQATVLPADELESLLVDISLAASSEHVDDCIEIIQAHIDALTEQVRVLADALEGIAVTLEHENDPFLERDNAHDLLADIRDITDTTLAALEGSGASE